MGGGILGMVVLGFIKNQVQQAIGNKPLNSTPPWLLHQLLSPDSCPVWISVLTSFDDECWYGSINQINPSLPNLLFNSGVFSKK